MSVPRTINLDNLTFPQLADLQRNVAAAMLKRFADVESKTTQAEQALETRRTELAEKLAKMAGDLTTTTRKVFGVTKEPVVHVNGANGHKRRARRAKAKRTVGVIKYRHPQDAKLGWTGQGRAPNWLVNLEKTGAKREQFAVA